MVALWKTHYSNGKSILKPERVLELCKLKNEKRAIFVEDTFAGFRKTFQLFDGSGVQLIYGIRLPVVQSSKEEKPSKIIIFAKNDAGIKDLKKLYSKTHCSEDGLLVFGDLKPQGFGNLSIGIPFYDSFVYNNVFHFGLSELRLDGFEVVFFEESNNHPFDFLISEALDSLGVERVKAKSIYYENYEDFDAFQFYKATTSRSGGKSPNYGSPNIDNFSSAEFCWESYLLNK